MKLEQVTEFGRWAVVIVALLVAGWITILNILFLAYGYYLRLIRKSKECVPSTIMLAPSILLAAMYSLYKRNSFITKIAIIVLIADLGCLFIGILSALRLEAIGPQSKRSKR